MPTWAAITFQDAASPTMEQLLFFHDHAIVVLILITVLTIYIILAAICSKVFNKFMIEGQEIETIWTILPAILLLFIAFPSIKILYLIEDTKDPRLTVKVIGHQWYWSYEHSTLEPLTVDRFMAPSLDARLIETTLPLVVPANTSIRVIVTSADVIHSWAVPALGLKVDAIPARLNQTFFIAKRLGPFVGQCSEICGVNHSFIPILVSVLEQEDFLQHVHPVPLEPEPIQEQVHVNSWWETIKGWIYRLHYWLTEPYDDENVNPEEPNDSTTEKDPSKC